MNILQVQGLKKASKVRMSLDIDLYQPINIFDICLKLGVTVQFLDINMEGFYINGDLEKRILLSCQRPLPRRNFTCGHELGHHMFDHGSQLDMVVDERAQPSIKDDNEILVDTFSANLLMPIAAIQKEFKNRNINIDNASAIDFYKISSLFGVGYHTLITHCRVYNLITFAKATELLKLTPSRLFKRLFGESLSPSYFKIIDQITNYLPVDLEESNYLLLPESFDVDNEFLELIQLTTYGKLYSARKTGITSISSSENESCFVRIQPKNYVGFAEYRHL